MKPTIIIGAGLTGLSAGYALQKEGRDVVILERTEELGGLARSLNLDGYIFDIGPHYFFLNYDSRADRLVKECLGDRAKVFDFQVSAIIGARNLAWPPDLKALLRMPPSSTLTTLMNTVRRRFPSHKDCEGFMASFYGRSIFDKFIGPYLRKKVPILAPDRLHREWWLQVSRNIFNQYPGSGKDQVKKIEARKKVPLYIRGRVLLNLIFGLLKTASGRHRRKVLYPEGGMGQLGLALAKKFEEAGGKIHFGVEDVALQRTGNQVVSVTGGGREYSDPQTVIWTGSIHELSRQLGIERADLPFIRILLGFVKVRQPLKLPPYLYTYYAHSDIVFNRAYFPSLIMDGLVPAGKDAVCVEISPDGSGSSKPLGEEEYRDAILTGLDRMKLCPPEWVEELSLMEVPLAYPVYPLDYYETLQALWAKLLPIENLWSIGRSGQFYYNNMARSISLSLDLVEHLMER